MLIHYAQILCSWGVGGAQAKEAAVCLWWRMKVFEKSGAHREGKAKTSVLITQQPGLELPTEC